MFSAFFRLLLPALALGVLMAVSGCEPGEEYQAFKYLPAMKPVTSTLPAIGWGQRAPAVSSRWT